MNKIIFICTLMLSSGAGASEFITYDNPAWTREDMLVRHAVSGKWYSLENKRAEVQVAAIDGRKPVIEISQERTGLPDEFEERVARVNKMKSGEKYAGR